MSLIVLPICKYVYLILIYYTIYTYYYYKHQVVGIYNNRYYSKIEYFNMYRHSIQQDFIIIFHIYIYCRLPGTTLFRKCQI